MTLRAQKRRGRGNVRASVADIAHICRVARHCAYAGALAFPLRTHIIRIIRIPTGGSVGHRYAVSAEVAVAAVEIIPRLQIVPDKIKIKIKILRTISPSPIKRVPEPARMFRITPAPATGRTGKTRNTAPIPSTAVGSSSSLHALHPEKLACLVYKI